jgi:hypothetical protein
VEKELKEVLWFDEAHTPLFWEFINGVDVYEKAASTRLDAYSRDRYVEPLSLLVIFSCRLLMCAQCFI